MEYAKLKTEEYQDRSLISIEDRFSEVMDGGELNDRQVDIDLSTARTMNYFDLNQLFCKAFGDKSCLLDENIKTDRVQEGKQVLLEWMEILSNASKKPEGKVWLEKLDRCILLDEWYGLFFKITSFQSDYQLELLFLIGKRRPGILSISKNFVDNIIHSEREELLSRRVLNAIKSEKLNIHERLFVALHLKAYGSFCDFSIEDLKKFITGEKKVDGNFLHSVSICDIVLISRNLM
jgi:hypothetical protein